MNSLRLDGTPHPEISINRNWLLGFLEGDGSFYISNNRPQFLIHLTASEKKSINSHKRFFKRRKCK